MKKSILSGLTTKPLGLLANQPQSNEIQGKTLEQEADWFVSSRIIPAL